MMKLKVVNILVLLCIAVSVEVFISKLICQIRWKNEENWELCMQLTNTTRADITPWKVIIPILSKPRNCLRLCVEQKLCPPSGPKSVPFVLAKTLNQCTYDAGAVP